MLHCNDRWVVVQTVSLEAPRADVVTYDKHAKLSICKNVSFVGLAARIAAAQMSIAAHARQFEQLNEVQRTHGRVVNSSGDFGKSGWPFHHCYARYELLVWGASSPSLP